MRLSTIAFLSTLIAVVSCNGDTKPPVDDTPSVTLAANLPVFARQANEVEIADSMNDVDPTFVLGSIVNTSTGQVHGLDNYLAAAAKPTVTLQGEVVFRHLIENSVAAKASYLDFVSAQLSNSTRAEVSVVKASKASMKNEDLDRARLTAELQKMPAAQRKDLGVIIGYVDFILSATLFRETESKGSASGYGAKIEGKWFNKAENAAAHHRLVAVWAPLTFVIEEIAKPDSAIDLTTAADRALKAGELKQLPTFSALRMKPYLDAVRRN